MTLQRAESLISTVPSTVTVTAVSGGAGQAVPPSATSARVRLANPRVGGPVEYKVGAAAWVLLDNSQGIQLDIDLATVALLLRKASSVAGAVNIGVEVDILNRVGLGAAGSPVDGGGTLVPYATLAAAQAAKPAASNPGLIVLVGAAPPYARYVSNGAGYSLQLVNTDAPVIGVGPTNLVATVGQPLTFTAASGVTGTPAPTVVYDVYISGALAASNITSGSYTPLVGGASLYIMASATNTQGFTQVQSGTVSVAYRSDFVLSAGRSMMGQSTSGYLTGYTRYNSRRRVDVKGGALVNPKLWFPSFTAKPGYVASPNNFTLGAALEYNGVSYPVTFSAAATVVMVAGTNWVGSDPIAGLTIPDGSTAWCRSEIVTALTTDSIPAGEFVYPGTYAIENVILGGTNSQLTGTGAMSAAASGGGALAGFALENPYSALYLTSAQPSGSSVSLLGVGDSIMDGVVSTYDNVPDAAGNSGWFAKGAYAAGKSFIKLTKGSSQLRYCVPSYAGDAYTQPASKVSDVVYSISTNDLNVARTLAQVQADFTALWASNRAAGARIRVFKVLPRTNASNVPLSAFGPGGIRDQLNAWLDTQVTAGNITSVHTFNDLFESGATGTWSDYATQTSDGTHPLAAQFNVMSSRFQTILAGW